MFATIQEAKESLQTILDAVSVGHIIKHIEITKHNPYTRFEAVVETPSKLIEIWVWDSRGGFWHWAMKLDETGSQAIIKELKRMGKIE
jgi:hypothetical protein